MHRAPGSVVTPVPPPSRTPALPTRAPAAGKLVPVRHTSPRPGGHHDDRAAPGTGTTPPARRAPGRRGRRRHRGPVRRTARGPDRRPRRRVVRRVVRRAAGGARPPSASPGPRPKGTPQRPAALPGPRHRRTDLHSRRDHRTAHLLDRTGDPQPRPPGFGRQVRRCRGSRSSRRCRSRRGHRSGSRPGRGRATGGPRSRRRPGRSSRRRSGRPGRRAWCRSASPSR